jgi:hypothetical protein
MPVELDIRQEYLGYTARFLRPAFELWGAGGVVAKAVYDTLSKHDVGPLNVPLNPAASNLSDSVITVSGGEAVTIKFAFDRLDFYFNNFTQQLFESIPTIFEECTAFLRQSNPAFKFGSHDFLYYTHAHVKGSTAQEFLKSLQPISLQMAGVSRGTGMIFNYAVPEKNWITQFIVDRSVQVPEALYVALSIKVAAESCAYASMLGDGRSYLAACLADLGLAMSEVQSGSH